MDGDQFITFRIRRLRRYKPHNEDVLKLEKRHGIVNCCRITIIIKVTDSFFRSQNKLDTFCRLNQSTSRSNLLFPTLLGEVKQLIREIKLDVTWSYVKRQTAKMKPLPSVFSSLNSKVKIFVFVANSRRHFSIFFMWFNEGLEEKNTNSKVTFAVCRLT